MGYDINRFEKNVDEELICPICSFILEDPVQVCLFELNEVKVVSSNFNSGTFKLIPIFSAWNQILFEWSVENTYIHSQFKIQKN